MYVWRSMGYPHDMAPVQLYADETTQDKLPAADL